MTPNERLIFQALAASLDTLRHIALSTQTVLPDTRAQVAQEQIEARLDSVPLDEVDADLPTAEDVRGIMK